MINRMLAAFVACAVGASVTSAADRLAVAWNDPATGAGQVRLVGTEAPWPFLTAPLTTGPDAILRYAQGRLYVVSASARTVTVVDPDLWTVTNVYSLQETGMLLDIAVVGPRLAYLIDEGGTKLVRLNLITGQTTRVVDLTVFAADCGTRLDKMALHEGRLFVQLQHGGGGATAVPIPTPRGCLAIVDTAAEKLVDAVPATPQVDPLILQGVDPKMKMQVMAANPTLPVDVDRLFVSASGGFDSVGAIEVVDADALFSLGFVAQEQGLGVDFRCFVMADPTNGFLTESTDSSVSSHLSRIAGGVVTSLHYDIHSYIVPALVLGSGYLFVPDGGINPPGIQVFDAQTGLRLTTDPLPTDTAPTDIERVP
jgi:hypothetical protein